MVFTSIDLQSWPQGQMFYYFSKIAPTGYSMTVNVDVTELRRVVREAGIKFFPAYLWLVTRNLSRQIEFKVAEKDGVLGFYDTLTPLYASFHEDDHTFSFMWTEYKDSFSDFFQDYMDHQKRFGKTKGILCQTQTPPPPNAYTVSCIPWVGFEHFAVHSYENRPYYFPSVEAGRFIERDGHIFMPLSLACHHATTDGYPIHLFLKGLKQDMEIFKQNLERQQSS